LISHVAHSSSLPRMLSTGGSVCSHQLKLIPHSRIFLPWRWKRRFTQELHGATPRRRYFLNYYYWWKQ
jgi:hypothetical protein